MNYILLWETGFLRAVFRSSKDLKEALWALVIIYSGAAEIFCIQYCKFMSCLFSCN